MSNFGGKFDVFYGFLYYVTVKIYS